MTNSLKNKIRQKYDDKCILCDSRNNLVVHHNTYDNYGSENDDELTLLCRRCHAIFHGRTGMRKPKPKRIIKDNTTQDYYPSIGQTDYVLFKNVSSNSFSIYIKPYHYETVQYFIKKGWPLNENFHYVGIYSGHKLSKMYLGNPQYLGHFKRST